MGFCGNIQSLPEDQTLIINKKEDENPSDKRKQKEI